MRDTVLSSKTVFDGRLLRVRVDEVEAADGHKGAREVVEHPGAVGAVVIHDGHVVLVRQYRHATGQELLEIPAGKLTPGEEPIDCVRRELVEEVGLFPTSPELIASFYNSPGFCNELFHLYLCQDLEPREPALEAGEVLTVERIPVADIAELVSSGHLRDAKTLIGLSLALLRSR